MSKLKQFIKNVSPLNNRTEMPTILYIIKVVIIFWFVKFVSELIAEGVVIALHFACNKNPLQGEMFESGTIMLISYYGYCLMVAIMILYWKLFQKKTLSKLGFTGNVGTYLIGGFIGMVLVGASVSLIILTGAITFNGVFKDIDHIYILLMLLAFVCQGAMEEVLCRGIVLQLLKYRTSLPIAIMVSTALFVIPHLFNMTGTGIGIIFFAVVNLILISLVFSFSTIYFKSIWPACGLHTIWNFIVYNILGLNLSGNDEMTAAVFDLRSVGSNVLNGGEYGIEASVITSVVCAGALVICCFISRAKENGKGGANDGI